MLSVSAEGATGSVGPAMAVVVDKACVLASRVSPRAKFPRTPRSLAWPAQAFELMMAAAYAALGTGAPPADQPGRALAHDLLAFLRAAPASLRRSLSIERGAPEPTDSVGERRASAFWLLAALVQDVWEHAMEETVRDRDRLLLEALADLSPQSLYDFGAGAGFFAYLSARDGAIVQCTEANLVKRQFLRFRRRANDVARLHLARAPCVTWNAALAIDVLDHVENPAGIVEALAARLVADARLFVQASFEADGWHRSGAPLVDAVYAALHRHFDPMPASAALSEAGVIVLRRRARARPDSPTPLTLSARVRLDPAAAVRPDPETGGFIVASPRFYADALRVSADGARLVEACRDGLVLGEITALKSGAADDVRAALEALRSARLITVDGER